MSCCDLNWCCGVCVVVFCVCVARCLLSVVVVVLWWCFVLLLCGLVLCGVVVWL